MRESETEHLTYAPSYARALRAIGTTARNRVPTSTGTAALYTRKKGAKKGAKAAERQPLSGAQGQYCTQCSTKYGRI